MEYVYLVAASLFLPMFPLSMLFVRLFCAYRHAQGRAALLLFWPQLGVWLSGLSASVSPEWMVYWALFTAALYGLRALVLREVTLWIGFMAVSSWSMLWLLRLDGFEQHTLHVFAFGFSAPMLVLNLLASGLDKRFGAAYAGIVRGLALRLPRFSAVLVIGVLAMLATPPSPAFGAMLATLQAALSVTPAAAMAVGAVWLLWSWGGAHLLQGMLVGDPGPGEVSGDLGRGALLLHTLFLVAVLLLGVYLIGELA